MEAETRVMYVLQKCQGLLVTPEARRDEKGFFPRNFRGRIAPPTP